jgi:hypothetical protein
MLTDQLNQVRRNPVLTLIVLAGGLILGVLIGVVFARGGGSAGAANSAARAVIAARSSRTDSAVAGAGDGASGGPRTLPPATAGSNGAASAQPERRAALSSALRYGVERADALGGEAAAAVWVGGDPVPILSGPTSTPHRMWSTSKAVVTIAALEATNDQPDPVLRSAMTDAIRRSDNCAIRRVIVGLQDRLDKGIAGTVAAFELVLATSGAHLERAPQSGAVEQACVRYLDSHQVGLPGSDLGVASLFGTAEWTQDDAISFAHALSDGAYGAPGASLLQLMGPPKEPPLEEPPLPHTPPLDWGAGAAFPSGWTPAWKGGWGGSQDNPPHYLATQIVVLHLGHTPVAVTAIFVPRNEPPNDNPGITDTPEALERMFTAVRIGLKQERVGSIR